MRVRFHEDPAEAFTGASWNDPVAIPRRLLAQAAPLHERAVIHHLFTKPNLEPWRGPVKPGVSWRIPSGPKRLRPWGIREDRRILAAVSGQVLRLSDLTLNR